MSGDQPVAELHPDYSDKDATARPWSEAVAVLTRAEVFWLSTARPDGRPHVTPLIGLWSDDALHFCTGPDERKARNLATNPEVVVTTGTNTLHQGFDVVVEGRADRVTDEARLTRLAELWEAKYGADWHFEVRAGAFANAAGAARRCSRWSRARRSASARANRTARPVGASAERCPVRCAGPVPPPPPRSLPTRIRTAAERGRSAAPGAGYLPSPVPGLVPMTTVAYSSSEVTTRAISPLRATVSSARAACRSLVSTSRCPPGASH